MLDLSILCMKTLLNAVKGNEYKHRHNYWIFLYPRESHNGRALCLETNVFTHAEGIPQSRVHINPDPVI